MNNNELNNTLYRPIQDGKAYRSLFSSSSCVATPIGSGTTEYGINQIKNWVLANMDQVNIPQAKKHFKKSTLQQTVTAIKMFAYNHFQYKADDYTQHLTAPACAWNKRYNGIDCKSYSVINSILLNALNLKHYIRRIKQPSMSPEQWSHVFVIVPKNQKNGSLNQGYYVADSTILSMQEPAKLDKHDIYMEANLPYVGLRGSVQTEDNFINLTQALLNKGAATTDVNKLIDVVNSKLMQGKSDFPIVFKRGAIVIDNQVVNFIPLNHLVNPNNQAPNTVASLNGFFNSFSDAWNDISGVATTTWGNLTGNGNSNNGGQSTLLNAAGAYAASSGTSSSGTSSSGTSSSATAASSSFDWGQLANDVLGTAVGIGGQLILNNNTSTGGTPTGSTSSGNTGGGLTFQQQMQLAQAGNQQQQQPIQSNQPKEKNNNTLYWVLGTVAVLGTGTGVYLYNKKK